MTVQAQIPARRTGRLTLIVAASAILVLIVAGILAVVAPTALAATADLEDGIEGCMGVRTTPGSDNTTKELVGGSLEPGGTARFRFTFPAEVDGNPGQEEWKITDCVFINDEPQQKYTVTSLENDVSPVIIEFTLTIPADTEIGESTATTRRRRRHRATRRHRTARPDLPASSSAAHSASPRSTVRACHWQEPPSPSAASGPT